MRERLQKFLWTLSVITDEESFFDTLDTIYADKELESYYEKNWIEILDDDEIECFDFETERKEILDELKEEITELSEGKFKNDIIGEVWELEK